MKLLRSKGPRYMKTNPAAMTKVYVIAGLAFVVCVALGVMSYLTVRNGQQANQARLQLRSGIETDLTQVVRTFEEISAPRADVQGTLLPKMRTHLYSAYAFNRVLTDAFGQGETVLDNQLYRDMEGAMDAMDKLIDQGQGITAAQGTLEEYVQQVRVILSGNLAGDSMV